MPRIIVNTTFRDFTGDMNDEMQINFLKSLKGKPFRIIFWLYLFSMRNRWKRQLRQFWEINVLLYMIPVKEITGFLFPRHLRMAWTMACRTERISCLIVLRMLYCKRISWRS